MRGTAVRVPEQAEVVVIGAGQAGLAVAYHLQRLGLRPGVEQLVLDRGPRGGGAWQHRWDALRLGSAHRVHDLPGMALAGMSFTDADRSRPASEVVTEYYEAYERFFDLRVARPVTVTGVEPDGAGLTLLTDAGRIDARVVVNATGTWGAPFVPHYPGAQRFTGRQVHTATYRSAQEFAGQRVLVVGGGTSAIGAVLELNGVAGRVYWVTRRPVEYLDRDGLGPEAGVAAVAAQDLAARAGEALPSIVSGTGVPITRRIAAGIERGVLRPLPMFERLEEHGVVWPSGRRADIDAIVWATGFRPDIRHLRALRLRERSGGVAVADGAVARDDRILLAGYGPTASTIGANRAGRVLARRAVSLLGEQRAPAAPVRRSTFTAVGDRARV